MDIDFSTKLIILSLIEVVSLSSDINTPVSSNINVALFELVDTVLEIGEQHYGSNHPHVAELLDNWGKLYLLQGQYQKAEAMYSRALKTREEILGRDHPDVATSSGVTNNLWLANKGQPFYL